MGYSTIARIVVAVMIVSVIAGFIYDYKLTKERLETKKAELIAAYEQIKSQNESIKKLEIDVANYKELKPQIIEKTITKYQNVKVTDETCEAKLNALQEYTNLFFKRNNDIVNRNYFGAIIQKNVEAEQPKEGQK